MDTEVAELLIDIESELRKLGLWSQIPPTEQALASDQPFCVDTLTLPMQGKRLREIAKELTGQDTVLLINTHYHLDHTHGNPAFDPGTRVLSTERTLHHLKALDADHLKIDRSFIIGIGVNESDEHIVRATMALAHSLGMETVAEGVDSREQLAFLQKLSCDYIQGYLFAKPLEAEDFETFVEERNRMAESVEGRNYA